MARLSSSRSLRNLEISSAEGFDRYFQDEVPQGTLSHASMKANLALAGDPKAFGERLLAMSKKRLFGDVTLAMEFLARLLDYTDDQIPKEHIAPIIRALLDVGDKLWSHDLWMSLPFGGYWDVARVIDRLLRRIGEPERFEALNSAISTGNALSTIAREVRAMKGEHGTGKVDNRQPEEAPWLNSSHQKEIEQIALRRIKEAIDDNALFQSNDPIQLLYLWSEIAGEDEPRNWVARYIEDDRGLAVILTIVLVYTVRHKTGDAEPKRIPRVHSESLEEFLEVSDALIERVRGIADADWLTDIQRTAVNQFIKEYDEQAKSGEDPDSPDESQDE